METTKYRFDEVTINHDKKRKPLSAQQRAGMQGEYRYYGAQSVIDYVNDYLFDGEFLLIAEDGENLKSGKQDIAQIVEGQFWLNNHAHIVQTNELCNLRYLGYWLNVADISGYITGSAQPKLSQSNMNAIELDLPSRKIQDKIVSILHSFDKKIEANNQINRNLSEQAQAVFNSWFVNYDPFDEPMKETPTGFEAPESFEYVQIDSLEHILETGRRPKGGAVSEGVPSVGAESVKGIGTFNTSNIKYIPVDFAAKQKTGKVNGYELMIYKDGGKPGEFHPNFSMFGEGYPFEEFFINEHVFKLDFGDRGYNEFAYFWFQTDYVMHWLESNGGKAAIPGINQNVVNSIWILSPDSPKVKEYCKWVQPLFTQILKNCYSNLRLAELRDVLLPKLMSGELDVSNLDI